MNKIVLDQACKVVSYVLKVDESVIPHDASIWNFSGWDSFAQVELMIFFSEKYGVEFSEENFQRLSSISGIIGFLEIQNGK